MVLHLFSTRPKKSKVTFMTIDLGTNRRANLIGSFWMVAAMAAFAVEDAFFKTISETLPDAVSRAIRNSRSLV